MIQAKKVKLLKLTSEYELDLQASTGLMKKDYIGKFGYIVGSCNLQKVKYSHKDLILFDIKFPDGALFCVERNQLDWDWWKKHE